MTRRSFALLVGLLPCVGCAGPEVGPPAGEEVIALASDFEGFETWPSITIDGAGVPGGHGAVLTRIYLLGEVPPGTEPFAVGAMLVKANELGAPSEWEVHAMVKRGGGYNPDGAFGWEWFDLAVTDALEPVVLWRGEGSRADPGGYAAAGGENGCNSCHVLAITRDFVFTRALLGGAE